MYTSDLRSISHVHAVFALPSVPQVRNGGDGLPKDGFDLIKAIV